MEAAGARGLAAGRRSTTWRRPVGHRPPPNSAPPSRCGSGWASAASTPDDVEVQAVSGRVDAEDRIADAATVPLKPAGGPDLEGRWVYEGPLALDRTGPFGYTVRILPAHPLLAARPSWAWSPSPRTARGRGGSADAVTRRGPAGKAAPHGAAPAGRGGRPGPRGRGRAGPYRPPSGGERGGDPAHARTRRGPTSRADRQGAAWSAPAITRSPARSGTSELADLLASRRCRASGSRARRLRPPSTATAPSTLRTIPTRRRSMSRRRVSPVTVRRPGARGVVGDRVRQADLPARRGCRSPRSRAEPRRLLPSASAAAEARSAGVRVHHEGHSASTRGWISSRPGSGRPPRRSCVEKGPVVGFVDAELLLHGHGGQADLLTADHPPPLRRR